MSDRFHRAARDGYLEVLKEATRRDCNHPDEDGLTPTLWASYEGNLDALRLIVGRGGEPDKCDNYGNTALHCAAARGHINCVSFLVNFGVNIWSLDNEFHTAKELAAMNNKDDILRYLDTVSAKQTMSDPKQVKKLQDKAQKDAEKRQKEFDKIQKKADKKREDENVKLQREREKIEKVDEKPQSRSKAIINTISRGSMALFSGPRKDSRVLYNNAHNSPKFSDLTIANNNNAKKNMGGIQKKIIKKKVLDDTKTSSDFKVREVESDGKKSVRNLNGLRRDSEIMFVPGGSLSSTNNIKRGRLTDVFETSDSEDGERPMQRTLSQPDFTFDGMEQQNMLSRGSLFARPGFGSVAFRTNSITATLSSLAISGSESTRASSAGDSSTSLPYRQAAEPWEEEDLPSDDESEATPVYLFLAAAGLVDFIPTFAKEHIDIDALMLLSEEDLISMKLPIGPRRKLLKAIADRKSTIDDPGEVLDSKL
ncbi:pre-mRNA splicing regulator USH1G isoform X2 [Procambarus clarkii]|uniref:pre-mRNA splicing regulator USH1G isoform X2 n=1 Tax=Procambarus clarkii TaxID=6728 RepID=UPI001E678DCC|nr:Usher syndrome type-1G protein homolog [Procambarus clarkii]